LLRAIAETCASATRWQSGKIVQHGMIVKCMHKPPFPEKLDRLYVAIMGCNRCGGLLGFAGLQTDLVSKFVATEHHDF
jgi:hypothetical protein